MRHLGTNSTLMGKNIGLFYIDQMFDDPKRSKVIYKS